MPILSVTPEQKLIKTRESKLIDKACLPNFITRTKSAKVGSTSTEILMSKPARYGSIPNMALSHT